MPATTPDGFPFELLGEEPGRTLTGGEDGLSPILAERVQDVVTGLRSEMQQLRDDLMADLGWHLVMQGTDAQVSSSITLTDSNIVIPVNGPTVARLNVRYESSGGGIRLAWRTTGNITGPDPSRTGRCNWWTPGATSTGRVDDRDTGNWRNAGLGTVTRIGHATTAGTSGAFAEALVSGDGELILQWAQDSSNSNATTLIADTSARWLRIWDMA